jgi:replicative DNA helicase
MENLQDAELCEIEARHQQVEDAFGRPVDDRMGIRSGLTTFDAMIRGFHQSKLYIGAARPGCGKTSFCTSITAGIMLQQNAGVLFISTELDAVEVTTQIVEAYAQGIPVYPNGRVSSPDEVERLRAASFDIKRQSKLGYLHVCHQKRLTMGNIAQEIVEHCDGRMGGAAALVIIDQASRIQRDDKERHGYSIATEHMLNMLEVAAHTHDVPILLMTQLNRAAEGGESGLANLKHSGAFEEYAHAAFLLEKDPDHGKPVIGGRGWNAEATINVAKNRHGRTGKIKASFYGECHLWRERP